MHSKSWARLALALSIPLLHACGGSSSDGYVRLVNATTDFSALDLSQSNSTVVSDVASDTVSSYAGVDAGTYTFDVASSGSGSVAAAASGAVVKKGHYTLVTYVTGDVVNASYLTDDETTPASGYAKLRIFNAADDEAGSVDVFVTAHDCTALTSADSTIASAVTGLESAYDQVTATSAGTAWHVCVTGSGDRTDLRLDIPALTFTSQQIATLILTKSVGGVLLNGLLLNQQGTLTSYANTSSRVRLVADAASAGVVSATANGTTLGTNFTSPTVSAYKNVTAGDLTLALTIAGTAVTPGTLTATAGADYTLLVAGTAADPTVTLIADDNTPSTNISLPVKMRLVNGLNGIGGAAILTVDGSVVGDTVAFGDASSTTDVAVSAAAANLQVSFAGSSLWQATGQTLTSGKVYTVFLLGDASAPSGTLRADR